MTKLLLFIINFILFNILITKMIYTQNYADSELLIQNNSAREIRVTFYPVSMVFRGIEDLTNNQYSTYNFLADYRSQSNRESRLDYINGVNAKLIYEENSPHHWQLNRTYIITPGNSFYLNQDIAGASTNDAAFGYGLYKMIINWTPAETDIDITHESDSLLMDYDVRSVIDHTIRFYDSGGDPRVFLQWLFEPSTLWERVSPTNYKFSSWEHYGQSRNYGNVLYNTTNSLPSVFPLDSRINSTNATILTPPTGWPAIPLIQNQSIPSNDKRFGNLINKLTLDKDVFTPNGTTYPLAPNVQTPIEINILNTYEQNPSPHYTGATLIVGQNKTLTLNTITNQSLPSIVMTVFPYAHLQLKPSARLNVNNGTKLILKQNSEVYLESGSQLRINSGGSLCNECAWIHGPGSLIISGRVIQYCYSICDNFNIGDSTKMELEDSASWILDPNTTITFDGMT